MTFFFFITMAKNKKSQGSSDKARFYYSVQRVYVLVSVARDNSSIVCGQVAWNILEL